MIVSYNPCFSGSSSATLLFAYAPLFVCFSYNPCFSGSSSATSPRFLGNGVKI